MALSQMYALTGGRRYREPYVSDINARKQYLPQIYEQRDLQKYRDQQYGLQQQGLALSRDALKEQQDANKRARLMGYANIGLGAGIGLAGLASDQDWFSKLNNSGTDQLVEGLAPDLSSLGKSIGGNVTDNWSSYTGFGETPGASSYLGDIWDTGGDVLKQFGGGLLDAGKGIYDSVVGDYFSFNDSGLSDTDWSDWNLY